VRRPDLGLVGQSPVALIAEEHLQRHPVPIGIRCSRMGRGRARHGRRTGSHRRERRELREAIELLVEAASGLRDPVGRARVLHRARERRPDRRGIVHDPIVGAHRRGDAR
jgi:hypothetical protein